MRSTIKYKVCNFYFQLRSSGPPEADLSIHTFENADQNGSHDFQSNGDQENTEVKIRKSSFFGFGKKK